MVLGWAMQAAAAAAHCVIGLRICHCEPYYWWLNSILMGFSLPEEVLDKLVINR